MDEDFLIQATNDIYRLTLFFPKKEPLKYKMREIASDILADGNKYIINPIRNENSNGVKDLLINDLKTLNGFFEVVKKQQWVSHSDILVVQKKYVSLLEELENYSEHSQQGPTSLTRASRASEARRKNEISLNRSKVAEDGPRQIQITDRQKKILSYLENKDKTQIQDVKQVFPEVTKRTLRRDFEQMLNQGLIKRIGERNETCYQIKINMAQ